eukprot:2104905-Rhodomonas_salina.3
MKRRQCLRKCWEAQQEEEGFEMEGGNALERAFIGVGAAEGWDGRARGEGKPLLHVFTPSCGHNSANRGGTGERQRKSEREREGGRVVWGAMRNERERERESERARERESERESERERERRKKS